MKTLTSKVKKDLLKVKAINEKDLETFSFKTRDNPNIRVYRDKMTGVIFIDDYYVGNDVYIKGSYRTEENFLSKINNKNFEDYKDTERRFNSYQNFIFNKTICDFGCGAGSFLKKIQKHTKNAIGIEIEKNCTEHLNKNNIKCFKNFYEANEKFDTITLFHCFEHLPNPLDFLIELRSFLKSNGRLIIEVPHAKDFLLQNLHSKEFKEFTLWSQHLVLHTRKSMELLLNKAGFTKTITEGVQRYNLSNHLHWLCYGKPSGHLEHFSILDSNQLNDAYKSSLLKIDATDTISAIAMC